jgi:hypothetical protein
MEKSHSDTQALQGRLEEQLQGMRQASKDTNRQLAQLRQQSDSQLKQVEAQLKDTQAELTG